MGKIEDLYLQDEAARTERNILEYNKDIGIINEVIKEILAKVLTKRPLAHSWLTPPGSQERLVSFHIYDEKYLSAKILSLELSIDLLSDGRILFKRRLKKGYYFNLKNVTDLTSQDPNIREYRLRERIVGMAVEIFEIKPKKNWGYDRCKASQVD